MNNYTFGNYICELREKKKLTQSQLGDKLGVTNKDVSRWENGGAYPSAELMLPLAEALGVTIEDLYKVISESKVPKTKLRIFLEWLSKYSKIISIICFSLALVQYILCACFYNMEDKITLLIITPIISALIFIMFYFCLVLSRKNPFASGKLLDIYTMIFLIAMLAGYSSTIGYFITDFPNGFTPMICAVPMGFMALVQSLKRRYK